MYAPIIITAFDRVDSLKRLIQSLSKNKYADRTDIYVGLDYPKDKAKIDKYNQVKNFLYGEFKEFRSFTLICREKNLGHKKNVEKMIDYVATNYDRWIVMGDDLEASPNFLEYMNTMLSFYEKDSDVVAVTGYSYPVEWKVAENCNVVKQSLTANDWGIGFWKDKYYEMLRYFRSNGLQRSFKDAYNKGFSGLTNWAITDYVNGVCHGLTPNSYLFGVFDVSLRIYISIKNRYVIMPTISKIRNWGFDGSGVNCQKIDASNANNAVSSTYNFSSQPIDSDANFIPRLDSGFDMDINREILNQFDYVEPSKLEETLLKAETFAKHGVYYRYVVNIEHIFEKVMRVFKKSR